MNDHFKLRKVAKLVFSQMLLTSATVSVMPIYSWNNFWRLKIVSVWTKADKIELFLWDVTFGFFFAIP